MWKVERGQSFCEPDEPSWRALVRGDWERAIALPERYRPDFDYPISPYLQWELHFLRVRAEAFERIRIVTADRIADV